ncbi:hypothetical protein [Gymnodinialimonas hymeniacidonis]|uniref:hypothetical protein n=1 Tax=Gymnodinialimonas hymeniacidonis TaxID=3126508 RepID=UPI0034C6AA52
MLRLVQYAVTAMLAAPGVASADSITCPEFWQPVVNEFAALLATPDYDGIAGGVRSERGVLGDCFDLGAVMPIYAAHLEAVPELMRGEPELCGTVSMAGADGFLILLTLPEEEARLAGERCQRLLGQLPLAISLHRRGLERVGYEGGEG